MCDAMRQEPDGEDNSHSASFQITGFAMARPQHSATMPASIPGSVVGALEFTRMNIAPAILPKKIEDVREADALSRTRAMR